MMISHVSKCQKTLNFYVAGVEFINRETGELSIASATKEVILCCGGLLTPKILLLSGIGPKQELDALGIENIRNLPGVGKNLQVLKFLVALDFCREIERMSVTFVI